MLWGSPPIKPLSLLLAMLLRSSRTTLSLVPSRFIPSFPFYMLFSLLKMFFPWFFTWKVTYYPSQHPMLSTSLLLALSLPLVFCLSTLLFPAWHLLKPVMLVIYLIAIHAFSLLIEPDFAQVSMILHTAKCFRKGCPWPQPWGESGSI